MGSIPGIMPQPYWPRIQPAKLSKAITDSLRLELKPWKIPVSIIEPGIVYYPDVGQDFETVAAIKAKNFRRRLLTFMAPPSTGSLKSLKIKKG